MKRGSAHGEKVKLVRRKTAKKQCSICRSQLHGVPHGKAKTETRKLSKTERRPSAPFAGVLCANCRTIAVEEAGKVLSGKNMRDVELRLKPFVETILKRL